MKTWETNYDGYGWRIVIAYRKTFPDELVIEAQSKNHDRWHSINLDKTELKLLKKAIKEMPKPEGK